MMMMMLVDGCGESVAILMKHQGVSVAQLVEKIGGEAAMGFSRVCHGPR